MARSPLRVLAAGSLVLVVCAGLGPGLAASSAQDRSRPAVIGVRVIGKSVHGRKIYAYHLGKPGAATTAVAVAAMHGNETAPQVTLKNLRDGAPVRGVNLWLVPNYNPDGVAKLERHNAHGVDLNRNYPKRWKPLTGYYYAGPKPASEPETKAMMAFLTKVDPDYVVSFHQPLYGIDTYGSKDRAFARRLAKTMYLPRKSFACGGVCHGTMTQWFNAKFAGVLVTVEYKADPSWRYLHKVSPNGLLRAFGGKR